MNEQKLDEALHLIKEGFVPNEHAQGYIVKANEVTWQIDLDLWWSMKAMQRGITYCLLNDIKSNLT